MTDLSDVDRQQRRKQRDLQVGRRIHDLRVRHRMAQHVLAEGFTSHSFISLVERGHRRPSLEHLESIAERLDTTLLWLLVGDPAAAPGDPAVLPPTGNASAQALLRAADHYENQFTAGVYQLRTWDVVQELRRQASEAVR